jgi:XTP/dITP diphosphohydrolase
VLILGSHNRKKARELVELLAPLGIELKALADVPNALQIEETGDSFAANAQLKASGHARHLGAWVLGEDSGIAVDALGGAPGIFSARYAGPEATDAQNNERLLAALGDTLLALRTAHYESHLVLADPTGAVRARADGSSYGRIRIQPAGSAGFGYDPIFEVVEYHRTFGELGDRVKTVLSHRARAVEKLRPRLIELVDAGELA